MAESKLDLTTIRTYTPLGTKDSLKALIQSFRYPPDDFRHYQLRWQGIYGWLVPKQAKFLFDQAKSTELEGDLIEIGSAYGRSTVCLAWGLQVRGSGKVYAVDPHTGGIGFRKNLGEAAVHYSSLDGFNDNIKRFGLAQWIEPIVKTSEDAVQQWNRSPLRLVFVDGWHTYDAVYHDILEWAKFLIPGGLMVMHDYQDEDIHRAIHDSMSALGIEDSALGKVDHQMVYFRIAY